MLCLSLPNLFFSRIIHHSPKPPTNLNPKRYCHRIFTLCSMSSSSSNSVSAEYALSGRSSCKKCSKAIAKSELRLGLVSRNSRGFDMTRWHHLQCLSSTSTSISSPEAIKGFSSLKSCDQEALRLFVAKVSQATESNNQKASIKLASEDNHPVEEVQKQTGEGTNELEQSNMKKRKVGGELEITFSPSAVKDRYKDATLLPKWKSFQTVIFLERVEGLHDSNKIAAFDFDGCLANTSVRRVGADAWSLMYPSIPEKLQSLYNDGYKLVIFTNEANIEIWKNKRQIAVDSKIGRLENFIKCVKLPIQVFIACGSSRDKSKDPFRKPEPGMWYLMEKHLNSGLPVDMEESFYVGDAAGRPSDHSDADIKFAEAIGLKFYVPEEFFSS